MTTMSAQRLRNNTNSSSRVFFCRISSWCKSLQIATSVALLVFGLWICWVGQNITRHRSDVALLSLRRSGGASSTSTSSSSSTLWWTGRSQKPYLDIVSPKSSSGHSRRRRTTSVKNRSTVRTNEFFLPPNESSWRYFDESASRPLDFSLHLPSNISGGYGQLPALWQCQHEPNTTRQVLQRPSRSKIIFVHLSRSAGNMVRSLLQYYGKHCGASYAVILACADLSYQTAQAGSWYNGRGRRQGNHCQLREAFNRTGGITSDRKKGYVSTAFLETMDIIVGQLPLGSADQAWKYYAQEEAETAVTTTTNSKKVQYILFLRDPISKFISEEVARASRTATTTQSAVAMIRQKVVSERAQGHYRDSFTPNLITPEQFFQYEFHEVRPTMEQYVNVTMSNLVDLNVMIGIVERMPQSLRLLQHVLDSQHALDDGFQYFGAGKVPSPRAIWPRNQEPRSTLEVLEQVRQDDALYRKIKEYVKYELKIYKFALELHKRQYEKLPKRKQQSVQQKQQEKQE